MSEELKKCPCGVSPSMATDYDADGTQWKYVQCPVCGLRTRGKWLSHPSNSCPIFYEEVRGEWNKVIPDVSAARDAALQEAAVKEEQIAVTLAERADAMYDRNWNAGVALGAQATAHIECADRLRAMKGEKK